MATILKYKFDNFEADLRAAELRRNGTRLKLQLQPFQVLVALLERPKEVITREELRQRLWPEDTFVDFDHGLNTAMVKLRDVLGDSASKPKYVETIAKRGYRFLGDAEAVLEPPKAEQPKVEEPKAVGAPVQVPFAETANVGVESAGQEQARRKSWLEVPEPELPRASRPTIRILFTLCQIMYLIFYLSALFRLDRLSESAHRVWSSAGNVLFVVYLVTSLLGVAVRLYLTTATAFDYHLLSEKYRVLFPALFILDMIWALSPFLIADRIGLGFALGAAAALIYMPFVQRMLIQMMARRG
ncbi:MAG TPA: winged helix-turn-helix domain-containing protein [Candidatus Angelobacter sp.]|jgi:DNA-binding winged helix-turn-helix (wHTH) protein|nr:winged helix-turn-helix domain-containing protein [Candidatus Angelobacter sp.]